MSKSFAFVELPRHGLALDDRGATAVEFAIVGPILIVLLIGVFAVGWAIYGVVTVRYALEESGRALMLDPSLTQDQLRDLVQRQVNDPSVTVSLSIDPQTGDERLAHVNADYQFKISIPLFPDYSMDYQTSITVPLAPT